MENKAEIVFFTKELRGQTVAEMIAWAKAAGYDGVDLCVRGGYAVNPDNARAELPRAARQFQEAGLTVPLISLPTDLTDPDAPGVDGLMAACHDAGVPRLKPGYWRWREGADYEAQVDAARRQIETWARKAVTRGVQICLHTHSGLNLGLNASAMAELVRGQNPAHLAVYLDTGHQVLCGEPPSLAFAIAGKYLSVVGVKDYVQDAAPGGGAKARSVPLGKGLVALGAVARAAKASGFAGPFTVHLEYPYSSEAELLASARRDLSLLRAAFAAPPPAP